MGRACLLAALPLDLTPLLLGDPLLGLAELVAEEGFGNTELLQPGRLRLIGHAFESSCWGTPEPRR